MGFLESLGKAMSNLLGSSTQAGMAKWEENMTLEEIEDLEAKGCDMTEYRQKYVEREARKAAEVKRRLEAIDYSLLEPYKITPRDVESDFVKEIISLNKIWKKEYPLLANSKIVYGAVVQAYWGLWEPADEGPMAAVFVFSLNEKYMYDTEWLLDLAEKISKMKQSSDVPEDNRKFIETLRDDQSMFCHKLGASLCGDVDAWCATFTIEKPTALPDKYLPQNKILPLLLLKDLKPGYIAPLQLIPAKYYNK